MKIIWELVKALAPIVVIALALWWAISPDELVCRGDVFSDAVCTQLDKSPFGDRQSLLLLRIGGVCAKDSIIPNHSPTIPSDPE